MTGDKPMRRPGAVRKRRVGSQDGAPRTKTRRLRSFKLGEGLPNLPLLVAELADMRDVLMGRANPPEALADNVMALHEYAEACYARASDIQIELMQQEREGTIRRGSAHYHFRTGELRTFREMAKSASELGSRRVTAAQLLFEMEVSGRETRGHSA